HGRDALPPCRLSPPQRPQPGVPRPLSPRAAAARAGPALPLSGDAMARGDTLIIFVRQPALGRVKRRLAAAIGAPAARRVYDRLTRQAIARLAGSTRWRTVLAVTPDGAVWRGWPRHIPRAAQGGGDLGVR